jgi:hypothetical protein
MNHPSLREVDKLSLALKQSERALTNLRLVQVWAQRNSQQHLEQGIQDLAHRIAQWSSDVRSLITVVRAQMQITTGAASDK